MMEVDQVLLEDEGQICFNCSIQGINLWQCGVTNKSSGYKCYLQKYAIKPGTGDRWVLDRILRFVQSLKRGI